MQPDTLTLSVDAANTGTPADETYTRHQESDNRSIYIGAAHNSAARDQIALYRTFPTRSGNFKGVDKSAIKITQDIEVDGVDSSTTLTAPAICELSFSFPVGITDATAEHIRQRMVAMLDDSTFMTELCKQLLV